MRYAILLVGFLLGTVSAFAGGHDHHTKHNMLLFGEETLFASHLVYKSPHNYQVILKLDLDPGVKATIASELRANPQDDVLFLLDTMDISQIQLKPKISGPVFRKSADGVTHPIFAKLEVDPSKYSVIYFGEVPLDLSNFKPRR